MKGCLKAKPPNTTIDDLVAFIFISDLGAMPLEPTTHTEWRKKTAFGEWKLRIAKVAMTPRFHIVNTCIHLLMTIAKSVKKINKKGNLLTIITQFWANHQKLVEFWSNGFEFEVVVKHFMFLKKMFFQLSFLSCADTCIPLAYSPVWFEMVEI